MWVVASRVRQSKKNVYCNASRDGSVGIVTRGGLDGLETEFR